MYMSNFISQREIVAELHPFKQMHKHTQLLNSKILYKLLEQNNI